jgi:hypothetical protein
MPKRAPKSIDLDGMEERCKAERTKLVEERAKVVGQIKEFDQILKRIKLFRQRTPGTAGDPPKPRERKKK